MTTATVDNIDTIIQEAQQAAQAAASKFYQERLGGQDQMACGFAWTTIYGVKGNTKLGRRLKTLGITPAYEGGLQWWNPSGHMCQNIDTKEEGAHAAADVLRKYGLDAYAGSRLD
jgi:hypothetical protein